MINNLLDNALKFTALGYVEFGAFVKDDRVEYFVKDTGVGIAKEQQEFVFGRFNQENMTLSREHEGSGLGLAITKGLVELMDGYIMLESKKGKGSTFRISLPLTFSLEYGLEFKQTSIMDVGIIESPGGSILVAEDDEVNYQLIYSILTNASLKNIIRARDGFEAVKLMTNNDSISLVLMDLKMPGLDGYEAIRRIREINADVPIVAISAFSLKTEEQKALDAGCNGFITKPYNPENVVKRINAIVANK